MIKCVLKCWKWRRFLFSAWILGQVKFRLIDRLHHSCERAGVGQSMTLCPLIRRPLTIRPDMLWQMSCPIYDSVQQDRKLRSGVNKHLLLTLAPHSAFLCLCMCVCVHHFIALNLYVYTVCCACCWCQPGTAGQAGPHSKYSRPQGMVPVMGKWFTSQPTCLFSPPPSLSNLKRI